MSAIRSGAMKSGFPVNRQYSSKEIPIPTWMFVFTNPGAILMMVFRLRLLKRLGQRADRGLRGVVRLTRGAGLAIPDRAHVDDRTALACAHAGQHCPDAVDYALEQHIDIVIEVVCWPASEVADM